MAYNVVSQADLELASNATDSDDSRAPSPQPQHPGSFEQLPLDTDHIGAGRYMQAARTEEDTGLRGLGSMIRSMTSASYDMVEEDDYEVADPSAAQKSNSPSSANNSPHRLPPLDATVHNHGADLRTPTSDHSVPLSHPTPGLQSLQGAYLNNVERLEKTAERLSSSSADIGSEIRKMDLEQKRRSSGSVANSVPASNHGSNVPGSRQGSIQSVTRLALVSEHVLDDLHNGQINQAPVQPYLPPPPEPVARTELHPHPHGEYNGGLDIDEMHRPGTAASGDTYQQARALFTDFDGVHFVPEKYSELGRRVSLTRPPLASRPEPYKQPQTGENMVYYPAPVPMMLNLPPRLSQRPTSTSDREKRRTQLLGAVPPENRKSAPWLPDQDQNAGAGAGAGAGNGDRRRTKQLSDLPPQLRASVFFEPPAASLEIDPTQSSAVATLDSILDASTTAPVTAFTDHPFAGPMGSEVYGSSKPKKKHRPKSAFGLDNQASNPDIRASVAGRNSLYPTAEVDAADTHESRSLRENNRSSDSDSEGESGGESESSESEYQFTGPPATLLAELEKRKHDLRQRRRTAANTGGLQSTLLQLEAVAQKQSEHRRQKPVALAWENPEAANNDEDEDEDVPLGMLFPDKTNAPDETRPLGLMEKREMEESEPLSRRRARLRGEVLPRTPEKRPMTMYSQGVQELVQEESGDEGETLGQRLRRLKAQELQDRPISKADTDFTTEILAELSNLHPEEKKGNDEGAAQEEETLGQRRARLKKEADIQKASTPRAPRYRRSMADILHARRPTTAGYQPPQDAPTPGGLINQRSFDGRMSMQQLPLNPPPYGPPKTSEGYAQYQPANVVNPYGYGVAHPNTFYSDAILGMGHLSYAMPPGSMRPVVDPGQRELIDRWRQGIM